MAKLKETASQTAGPYVHIGLAPRLAGLANMPGDLGTDIAGPNAAGERIRIEGCIFDGMGEAVKDALIEIWQANAAGHYAHPEDGRAVEDGFRGWGRAVCNFDTGQWGFDTIKPGRPGVAPGPDGTTQAPHILLWIVARGINIGLHTRLYFSDEDNSNDPVLALINPPDRRKTLIATRNTGKTSDKGVTYRFDIHIQGPDETVFLDI